MFIGTFDHSSRSVFVKSDPRSDLWKRKDELLGSDDPYDMFSSVGEAERQ